MVITTRPSAAAPLSASAANAADTAIDLMVNAMTVDVEDYFHADAVCALTARGRWPSLPCRIERNVGAILALLHDQRVHATFFTLGWIARRYPGVVRAIAAGGHELASHGYTHQDAATQTRVQFRRDILRSKGLLEDLSGQPVLGYRAPRFSLAPGSRWAFDTLYQAGYRYSSSMYPRWRPAGGPGDAPRFAFFPAGGAGILELPVSTARLWGRNVPAGGGLDFRLLPYAFTRTLLRRINRIDGQRAIFQVQPWELDPGQPRIDGIAAPLRLAHYANLADMAPRLECLARDFRWDRIDRLFPVLP